MRPTFVPFVALFAVACTKDSDTGDTNVDPGEIDCEVDGSASAYTALWGIDGTEPDCEAIDLDGCADPVVMEGNTRFFVGEMTWGSDNSVCGYEAKVLYPNARWKETVPEVDDCIIVWQLSGTVEPGTGTYDYLFTLHAALDQGQTDCLSSYVASETAAYDETYNVNITSDGTATVFFPSGTMFANGLGNDGALSFASNGDCEWIGTGECN